MSTTQLIGAAPDAPMYDKEGKMTRDWVTWFTTAQRILSAVSLSGTTANRPTKFLYAGRMYFDTSLAANGKPIWLNKAGTGWVDATGAAA